ncbi:hypothetical protein MTP99_004128 [Tenebrio molitor]|nr:hypothetical protein MTP99_004128 [Tenebrio molitor]
MTFQLLKLLFKTGKFFAITPPTLQQKKQTLWSKIWATVLVLVLTAFTMIWFIARSRLYMHFIHIKFVMRVLRHLIKYSFCCYVIVAVNFTKRRRWFKLVKKLECVSEAPRPTSRFYYLEFFCANVIFWVVISVSGYILNRYFDNNIVEIFVMILFAWYCLFFYKYLFYTILKMLLLRYQHLNSLVKEELRKESASSGFLQKVEFVLYTLKDAVDCFNDIFGWPLLFVILHSSLLVLDYVDDFFNMSNYNDEKLRMVFVINISLLLMLFPAMGVPILFCDAIRSEMKKIVKKLFQLRRRLSPQRKQQFHEFVDYCVCNSFPEFSAAGFFTLDKSTIFTILGTITTFLVIMVQFDTCN